MVGETSHRRQGLLFIGFVLVAILILAGPSLFTMFPTLPGQPEVIYTSPGDNFTISNGKWFARTFVIDDAHQECGIGVDGDLFSHSNNEDNIMLEFGYAHLSLTSFMSLNDTEKIESFEGYCGSGWDLSGTQYSTGYLGIGLAGEYVWAIRFIDLDDSSAVFETSFEVSLIPM